MTTKRRIVVVVVLALVLAAGGVAYLRLHRPTAGSTLTLYGDVDIREVQPAFNDSGHITSMLVQQGAVVKRGELICSSSDLLTRHPNRYHASCHAA
jgi:HlyD family secretion protein